MTEADRPPTADDAALAARLERLAQRRAPGTGGKVAEPSAPPRRARRHPAASARAAAIGLSAASTVGLTAFFAADAGAGSNGNQVAGATIVGGPSTTTLGPTTSAVPVPASTAVVPSSTVDGAAFSNRWGDVQVEATFGADGTIVSVDAIRFPNDRGRSISINHDAVPRLNAEVLTAQSASVDSVSGATYTSNDYRRSLQSAIDAARAANLTQLD
jgi:uncharacterized protein with FMN-binding domain